MTILTHSNDFVRASDASWQQHMKLAVRCPTRLAEHLGLPEKLICPAQSKGEFPLFVPLPYLSRIKKGDPFDPLLLQVLPSAAESQGHPGFTCDPVGESGFEPVPGLLHKYEGRALLIVTGTCAIHCRYCFRRHFPYENANILSEQWQSALNYIQTNDSIREVILSGGDPLTLVDDNVERLIHKIAAIKHATRLRVHTRLPIVIPQRITNRLANLFAQSRLSVVVVVHCNHANEIDDDVARAIELLNRNSITVLNQAVLLRGINDETSTLVQLSEKLFDIGVLPYYLHQLDPVGGAAHFDVAVDRGRQLIEQMRSRLPGYLVPRYVRETAGQPNKNILA